MSQSRTLIGVVPIVKRPYKARIEVRKSSDGYSATIVLSNAEKYLSKIVNKLKNAGYKCSINRDQYNYMRIHIPNLKYYDVVYIRKLVEDVLSTKEGEELALCTN